MRPLAFAEALLRGVWAGINSYARLSQDRRLAGYALRRLREQEGRYVAGFFDAPSLENTSVLRDYVHHLLTKEHTGLEKVSGQGASMLQVVRWLEQKKYRVLCGGLANILFGVYRGLGYAAVLSDWVDLEPTHYTDAHVLVEVFLPELGKYVTQDAAYNMLLMHEGVPINTLELMSLLKQGSTLEDGKLVFVNNMKSEEGVFTPVKDLTYEGYLRYFGQPVTWESGSKRMYPAVTLRRVS